MVTGTLTEVCYCLENKTALPHLSLGCAHCFKKCCFQSTNRGNSDRDKDTAKGEIKWMVEKYGSFGLQTFK